MAKKPDKKRPKARRGSARGTSPLKPKEKPDVRGYIMQSLDPAKTGWVEKGHLEGKDALSAVPPETLAEWREMLKSGKAKITVRRVKKSK